MLQLKLILIIIRKNLFSNIGLAFLYSFLFVVFFLLIFSYFFMQNFFSSAYNNTFLEIESIDNKEKKLDYKFLDSFEKEFPKAKAYPSFFIRVPTMMEISFFGKTFETDTFLMGYSEEFMKLKGYKQINDDKKDEIGLSISNEVLIILKNFLFSELSAKNLNFFKGDIVFGRSSIFGKISPHPIKRKNFYIKGISNSLPIYAIAMDSDKAIEILKEYNILKKDIKLHKIQIVFKDEKEKINYENFIKNYNKNNNTKYHIEDTGKDLRELKDNYENIFYIVLSLSSLFFLICILVITELSLQNFIYKLKNIIKVALYSQFPRIKIFMMFSFIFLFIVFICMIILFSLFLALNIFSANILNYIGDFSVFFSKSFSESLSYFYLFILIFSIYYLTSLIKKIFYIKI